MKQHRIRDAFPLHNSARAGYQVMFDFLEKEMAYKAAGDHAMYSIWRHIFVDMEFVLRIRS